MVSKSAVYKEQNHFCNSECIVLPCTSSYFRPWLFVQGRNNTVSNKFLTNFSSVAEKKFIYYLTVDLLNYLMTNNNTCVVELSRISSRVFFMHEISYNFECFSIFGILWNFLIQKLNKFNNSSLQCGSKVTRWFWSWKKYFSKHFHLDCAVTYVFSWSFSHLLWENSSCEYLTICRSQIAVFFWHNTHHCRQYLWCYRHAFSLMFSCYYCNLRDSLLNTHSFK